MYLNKTDAQKDLYALYWTKLRPCAIWLACLIVGGNLLLSMPPIFTIEHLSPTFNSTQLMKCFITSSLELITCMYLVALHMSSFQLMFGGVGAPCRGLSESEWRCTGCLVSSLCVGGAQLEVYLGVASGNDANFLFMYSPNSVLFTAVQASFEEAQCPRCNRPVKRSTQAPANIPVDPPVLEASMSYHKDSPPPSYPLSPDSHPVKLPMVPTPIR